MKRQKFAGLNSKHTTDALFPMTEAHLYLREALMQMLCQMLGCIDRPVLTACATKGKHERGEATLDVAADMGIGQRIDVVQKREYFTIILQELLHRVVKASQLLILLIATGIVSAAAVEHIATAIAAVVMRNAFLIAETVNAHNESAGR